MEELDVDKETSDAWRGYVEKFARSIVGHIGSSDWMPEREEGPGGGGGEGKGSGGEGGKGEEQVQRLNMPPQPAWKETKPARKCVHANNKDPKH
jgi:hypothetical protein